MENNKLVHVAGKLAVWTQDSTVDFLFPAHLQQLESAFEEWAESRKFKKVYRQYLMFLVLRYTAARIGEVVLLDDFSDIDFENSRIKLMTLKQQRSKNGKPKKVKPKYRVVSVPPKVTGAIANYKGIHPDMHRKVFQYHPSVYRKLHVSLCQELKLPANLQRVHVLRHTRAIEMTLAGVPLNIVKAILGHKNLSSTTVYLNISSEYAEDLLKEKGLI